MVRVLCLRGSGMFFFGYRNQKPRLLVWGECQALDGHSDATRDIGRAAAQLHPQRQA